MKSPIELVMVSDQNNNKYYRMVDTDDGNFTVYYGRVGGSEATETYPIYKWDTKYKEKLKKGYRDVSDLKIESKSGEYSFKGKGVEHFFNTFSKYTKDSVKGNYTIAVGSVTKAMLDEAQGILNHLIGLNDVEKFNKYLLELYTVLPRRMSNVKDYLVKDNKGLDKLISKEQDVLDSLSSSVVTNVVETGQVFEDSFGIEMEEVDCPQSIKDLVTKTKSYGADIYKVYKVIHKTGQEKFDTWLKQQDNKNVELLFHGTRNPNVFSILKSGLLIRPTNAVSFAGSAYGDGVYHSAHFQKSLGYTGYDSDKIFFIQSVHMGKPYEYSGWYRDGKDIGRNEMNYPSLKKKGYDSLFVKPGDGLQNSEYIVYNAEQTVSSYLLWCR